MNIYIYFFFQHSLLETTSEYNSMLTCTCSLKKMLNYPSVHNYFPLTTGVQAFNFNWCLLRSIWAKGVRNLLMDCDARQERDVLLLRMSHEDHVDVIEGPCLHQVDLSSNVLLRRGSKNCYLVRVGGRGINLAFRCENIQVKQRTINRDIVGMVKAHMLAFKMYSNLQLDYFYYYYYYTLLFYVFFQNKKTSCCRPFIRTYS